MQGRGSCPQGHGPHNLVHALAFMDKHDCHTHRSAPPPPPPPGLKGVNQKDPWALSFGDLASFHLERCLGAYPVDFGGAWSPPDYWDAADIALEMPEHPNVWTDGSREDFSSIGGFEVAGTGLHLPASELACDGLVWGTAEEYGDARLERCRAFLPVSCRLFSVLSFGVPL